MKDIVVIFLIIIAFVVGIVRTVHQFEAYSSIQKIESIRADVAKNSSEDVVGQATQWNQEIKSSKYWNSVPILELMIPDVWDDVDLIEIPINR